MIQHLSDEERIAVRSRVDHLDELVGGSPASEGRNDFVHPGVVEPRELDAPAERLTPQEAYYGEEAREWPAMIEAERSD